MKQWMMMALAATFLGTAFSCKEEKQAQVIIAPKPVEETHTSPTRMNPTEYEDTVTWLGRLYRVKVNRFVADSLPMLKDDEGHKFYDNMIRVRIIRPDGSEFFNRVFQKKNFAEQLDDHTLRQGALLGIVIDKAAGDYLQLAASVGTPDVLSDEYIPLIISISGHGEVSYRRDTKLEVENKNPQGYITDDGEEDDGV